MLRTSRWAFNAAHEAARQKQFEVLANRKGVYRKGVWAKIFAGSIFGFLGYFPLSMAVSSMMEEDDSGRTLASPTSYHLFEFLPFDTFSRTMGSVATSTAIPTWVHRRMIDAMVAFFGADLNDVDPSVVAEWKVLQDFFVRKLKDGIRPINEAAYVTSPCDGELIKCGVVDDENKMVQVKGCTYTVQNLFRSTVAKPSPDAVDTVRYYFAFRLGPQDYHRFHAPIAFRPLESVHVPGHLFPVMRPATKWIPMLYVNNERVILNGVISATTTTVNTKGGKKGTVAAAVPPMDAVANASGKISMAFVGASGVGGIHLGLDSRVKTNLLEPPPYALHRKYDKAAVEVIKKGDEVGYFSMGSAIVMVVDVPKDAPIVVTEGQRVKVGQAIVNASA